MPLLRTKLYRPSVPGDLILRPRLIDRMTRGLDTPLVLISAPAGYGKTMLVSSWLDSCPLPSAWISLDENDNDLRVFLAYLVAAVQSVFPESLQHTQLVISGPNLAPLAGIASTLINELDELESDFILVLDDLYTVHDQEIYQLFTALLRHPPRGIHLILITRRDPPLPLESLRAQERMIEIRGQELRFSEGEIAAFADQVVGLHLPDEALAVLVERTEGWAAGLRLAALTLRYSAEVDYHSAELHAENRYVMDYLVAEVLAHVPPEIEDFLVRTSILDWLCGPLCDAVMGWSGSLRRGQERLQWLENANLFTVSLDNEGVWYRYHSLFRRLLRLRLDRLLDTVEIETLNARASAWFADNESIEKALQHALAAHDLPRAVDLVARHRHELLNIEQRPRLERWLGLFPDLVIAQYPDLLLAKAWIVELSQAGTGVVLEMLDQTQALVDGIESPERARQFQGEIDALRSLEKSFAGNDPPGVVALATRALAALPREWYLARSEAWLHLAVAYQLSGQLARCYAILASAQGEDTAAAGAPRARNTGAGIFIHWMAADLPSLQQAARSVVANLQATHLYESLGWAHYALACANYHRNDLVAAEQHASAVHELRYVTHRLAVTQTAFVLAAIHQARGLPDQARQALAGAEQYLRETRSEALLSLVRAYEAELAAVQGDLATAGRWAATVGPYVPLGIMAFFYAPQLTLAKILLTIDTPASRQQAADELARLYAFVTSTYTTRFTIDVLALQALLHAAEGDEPAALAVLAQAIALAQPGDFIRPFVDLGPRMAHLFAQQARREGSSDYVRQVLGVFPSFAMPSQPHPNTRLRSLPVSQADLVEPLTRRELEILELLVRRLSAKEIAHHLVISDRTVKRHTANIYQKLGVNSRQQAVSTAMALGLLTPAALEQI